ncbi:MAG: TatD family hydrolase, partial [Acidimicrobiales bacterium]
MSEGAAPPGCSAAAAGVAGRVRWFDTHCHVQDEPEPEPILAAAAAAGVGALVCVGTDVESSRRALQLASLQVASLQLASLQRSDS